MSHIKRREFIRRAAAASALVAVPGLVACGTPAQEPARPAGTATTAPAKATAAAASKRGPSTGELRVSEPFLPATLDPDSGSASFNLQSLGVSETLMRYTSTLQVEPWIAKSLERVDDLTWTVTLRDDVTFTDGSKLDAEAVKASFMRTMEKQPGAVDLLPKSTVLTASGLTLTIKTAAPTGLMPKNLAAANLAIKKTANDKDFVFTGPFKIDQFTARESATLSAYPDYRGGPAWIKTIRARQVADVSTRSLALQSGDVEVAQALVPSDIAKLKANANVFSAPWARQHMIVLNVRQAPLNDVAVRRAFSLSIDREALLKGIMEGVGSAAYGIAPEDIGFKDIIRTQKHDAAEAKRVLETAGWKPGPDGIRVKDGQRLAFKIGTYAGRAELEQMAVAIIDMAKAAGIALTIDKLQDVEKSLGANEFQSTTYSIGSGAFGDVSRLLATLYTPSPRNKDRYANAKVTGAYQEFVTSSDAAKQTALLKDIQTWIGEDVPIVHLVNPYQIVGASKKVTGFQPHPLDSYRYGPDMRLQA